MKSKVFYIFDQLFYFLLLILPICLVCITAVNGGYSAVSDGFALYTGYFAGTDLYTAINEVIGPTGQAPLLNARSAWFVDLIVYAVYLTAFHLLIDCLKFIFSCAHRLMNKIGGDWFE